MTYILKNSNRKGKRFVIIMPDYNHKHHFGSDVGQTYIDHKDKNKRSAWIARHKDDKNYNVKHSGIFHARHLLWNKPTLSEALKDYKNKFGIKIINKTNIQ